MKRDNYPNMPDWTYYGAEEMLKAMGYDLNRDIHEQFIERYGEKISSTPTKKIKRGRPFSNNLPPTKK